MDKFLSFTLVTALLTTLPLTASARPEFPALTGASGCTACHFDNLGSGFKPGVLEAAASPKGEIAGLRDFINAQTQDTKPVLHAINSKWDITVGEAPLVIPLQVTDAEDDTFDVHGTAPSGFKLSSVYTKNNLPTVDFKWSPTAAQANKTYPLKLYVQENSKGRNLTSNTVNAIIQVWPARTGTTKNITQFLLQSAQWKNKTLIISGSLAFKAGLTATQKSAALAKLNLNITSAKGVIVTTPKKIAPSASGSWSKSIALSASEVPCWVIVEYEGLKTKRQVSQAPLASCVN